MDFFVNENLNLCPRPRGAQEALDSLKLEKTGFSGNKLSRTLNLYISVNGHDCSMLTISNTTPITDGTTL